MNNPCLRPAPCGGQCVGNPEHAHTIHTCYDPRCLTCHGGAVHAAALLERRRAIAERAKALIRVEMDAHAEGLDE